MLKILLTGRRRWMTLAVLIGVAVCCRLGIWQLDRLAQRRAQNALIHARMAQPAIVLTGAPVDPDALDYRRVEARGVYDFAQEIVLLGRAFNGAPGVHVITPLRLAGSDAAVLVDRGWLPLDQSSPEARRAFTEPGTVAVQGVARRPPHDGPRNPQPEPGQTRLDRWLSLDIPRIQAQTGYPLLPLVIEEQPAPGQPALPRRVATTDLGEGPHLGYAIQWFAFAVILLVGYLALMYQQAREQAATRQPAGPHPTP
jgi:surfeit locus 1 family protein